VAAPRVFAAAGDARDRQRQNREGAYPEWFEAAAPPMRFELRRLLATGLKQKRIHRLS
jgi:hypothetical protein